LPKPPKTWKTIELKICRKFGGERAKKEGEHGPDCKNTYPFAVQVKHFEFPDYLLKFMAQTVMQSKDDELPVLVMHPKGHSIGQSFVCMRLCDYEEWFL
jgi:hypothetical protein